ncbi:hypothetical protein JOF41_001961 [Saccharothrix coeruleofusca]|uniref:hypothetical protein n=1 Tax=Saccharothrix coeruleofusca TaxID=33919 RepID=UPI001AE8BD99|nr:hypothetical protein [Saccharothrix coeruleofusca]MBP2335783.1 hypothetical protein [Saccharothrix coeruleofusca]
MTRLLRALASLSFAAGVAAVALPGTAAAAETAHLTKTQHLAAIPNSGMPRSCTERHLYLREGRYDWGLRMNSTTRSTRPNLELGSGWYTWDTCLKPEYGYYIQTSVLDPDTPGWADAITSTTWTIHSSTTYTWGTFLDPHF